MRYFYRAAPNGRADLFGAGYLMEMSQEAGDTVRVEVPHIRFLCRGTSTLRIGEDVQKFEAPEVIVCGPSFRTGEVSVSAGTTIVGVSLTPAGWQTLLGVPASDWANRKTGITNIRKGLDVSSLFQALNTAGTDDDLFTATDQFLNSAILPGVHLRSDFLEPAMRWITHPQSPGVDALISECGLSPRQVDRLCRRFLGGSPKQVHRVYRALNIAYRLAAGETGDWRDLVDPYYDQSHFIRDFRDRIGCTPNEFTKERVFMMRFDVELRGQIEDLTRYALIG